MSRPDARRPLAELVRQGGANFSLAEAALWIAVDDLPDVDPAIHLARLDEMAARARSVIPASADCSAERGAAFIRVLFREERITGNTTEYDDQGDREPGTVPAVGPRCPDAKAARDRLRAATHRIARWI